jgi:hypothetical protein
LAAGRALNMLRPSPAYKRECFDKGLQAVGFTLVDRIDRPTPEDLLLIWNRQHAGHEMAQHFERHGARVVVAENGAICKSWIGRTWFTVTLGHAAGAGTWRDGGPDRWDSWGVDMKPFREDGSEVVIFAQRSIGEPGHASPMNWAETVQKRIGGRIRPHPGAEWRSAKPLDQELAEARCAVTWHSAAGLQSLLLGCPVFYGHPTWIGAEGGTPLENWGAEPNRSEERRLQAFRRAAWAMWTPEEIERGEPLAHLLA